VKVAMKHQPSTEERAWRCYRSSRQTDSLRTNWTHVISKVGTVSGNRVDGRSSIPGTAVFTPHVGPSSRGQSGRRLKLATRVTDQNCFPEEMTGQNKCEEILLPCSSESCPSAAINVKIDSYKAIILRVILYVYEIWSLTEGKSTEWGSLRTGCRGKYVDATDRKR
jgi:hypothetical protein